LAQRELAAGIETAARLSAAADLAVAVAVAERMDHPRLEAHCYEPRRSERMPLRTVEEDPSAERKYWVHCGLEETWDF
jgi:hypothetical protein